MVDTLYKFIHYNMYMNQLLLMYIILKEHLLLLFLKYIQLIDRNQIHNKEIDNKEYKLEIKWYLKLFKKLIILRFLFIKQLV